MSDALNDPTTPVVPTVTDPAPVADPVTPKVYDEAYVKELRQEAAAARVAKKDAVDTAVTEATAAHAAELAERDVQYTQLQNELGQAWIELEKVYVALDSKVPSEHVRAFSSLIQGTDKESIGLSAKAAYDLAGGFTTRHPAYDPSQGRGGSNDLPLNGDPILDAISRAVGAKRRST